MHKSRAGKDVGHFGPSGSVWEQLGASGSLWEALGASVDVGSSKTIAPWGCHRNRLGWYGLVLVNYEKTWQKSRDIQDFHAN